MKYNITLESFEGPFDLLYHLIEKSEVDIYDVSIAKIAEQYIEFISKMQELDLEVTSEFLLMAATLLEIKSKMLLPKNDIKDDQMEMEGIDPREELIERLIIYKKYKNAANELKNKFDIHGKVFYKPKEEISYPENKDITIEGIDLNNLVKAFDRILKSNNFKKNDLKFHEIKKEEMSIEQAMKFVQNKLDNIEKIEFTNLFEDKLTRTNIVAIFVAILELLKLKKIDIIQENNFTDISIRKKHR
ncbi:segregation and condensation protein A [Senegalia massiliensis]|uniref:Segregation and condensation protein A n=1 Tax=Senegalia massiliensis TaxID=1720316 RepID=A0A845QWW6_9CLOT|nr:segregation/condensation protein A [Senegalia massiliensis]NBI06610.1 segregation/condensation protein A [Senegalia massiliensis]